MKIFYDVDTQNDFMNKNGALYVPDAELIKPNLAKLTNFARDNFVPVIGSVDKHFGTPEYKHREGELQRWGGPFLDHCMDGTIGQEKIIETILEFNTCRWEDAYDEGKYIQHNIYEGYPEKPIPKPIRDFWKSLNPEQLKIFWNELRSGVVEDQIELLLDKVKKVINKKETPKGIYFEKQSYDVFTNPAFPAFLKIADIKQAVVYGVATDYCVKAAVLGMQKEGIQCYVVTDAIKAVNRDFNGNIDPNFGKKALEEMANARAKLITINDVLKGKI